MAKRSYTNLKAIEAEIISMRNNGLTRQQIADALGLNKSQIKNWIYRYNLKIKNKAEPQSDKA